MFTRKNIASAIITTSAMIVLPICADGLPAGAGINHQLSSQSQNHLSIDQDNQRVSTSITQRNAVDSRQKTYLSVQGTELAVAEGEAQAETTTNVFISADAKPLGDTLRAEADKGTQAVVSARQSASAIAQAAKVRAEHQLTSTHNTLVQQRDRAQAKVVMAKQTAAAVAGQVSEAVNGAVNAHVASSVRTTVSESINASVTDAVETAVQQTVRQMVNNSITGSL